MDSYSNKGGRSMITCGIDASSSCTGLCLFDNFTLVYYNKFRPDKDLGFRSNTCQIIEKIAPIIDKYKPAKIYMEDVPQFAKQGSRGKNMLKPIIALGAVQGIFYHKICFEMGYSIEYVNVDEWRQELGFLKGNERKREEQKQKAIDYVNREFNLDLQFKKGSHRISNDDDIAEAIAICWSQIKVEATNELAHAMSIGRSAKWKR